MKYKIAQIRYYLEGHPNNWPKNITFSKLISGEVFRDYTPIVQLGVQYSQDQPIKFYINGSSNPILSHPYGLFELDLTNKGQINSLKFDVIDDNGNIIVNEENPLIVDIVYIDE